MKTLMKSFFVSAALATAFISFYSAADNQNIVTTTKEFRLKLSETRMIYNPASSGAALSVTNPQSYPILVQGKVFAEDKKTPAPFIVTPPLSRLEAQQQSRLRVIRTGGSVSNDRETLQWLCVGGIPPKDTDVWADKNGQSAGNNAVNLHLEVSAHQCIKLLVRPSGIHGSMLDAANSLKWQRQGNTLTVTNPSPFYINLLTVNAGGKEIANPDYIAPFASQHFSLPAGAAGQVQWKVITDEGGESQLFHSAL